LGQLRKPLGRKPKQMSLAALLTGTNATLRIK
jgi:hypothetical protein